ncbi:hypothetical protein VOLCADRAFT_103137 [Volvox carteri f. nagariensis]|uniref:Protein kinase domain-containing protein n=1 Tax=Volvox carteri f. nagariensis TaxID=3068 RepID=D8TKU1_VOLCA|nr:uncharacterized protein VOLCADRAFT_103137 [Volvox carteri f. nagariensis]EFJ52125.1 hypothetical protein VOLCADRAFT_103137 [Volvox carteri f. nagariensis]|eukprot:XP_002946899.1 hypothetical protein VOLCADRAFT_103137 [Volvox carteri f. nagariensis]
MSRLPALEPCWHQRALCRPLAGMGHARTVRRTRVRQYLTHASVVINNSFNEGGLYVDGASIFACSVLLLVLLAFSTNRIFGLDRLLAKTARSWREEKRKRELQAPSPRAKHRISGYIKKIPAKLTQSQSPTLSTKSIHLVAKMLTTTKAETSENPLKDLCTATVRWPQRTHIKNQQLAKRRSVPCYTALPRLAWLPLALTPVGPVTAGGRTICAACACAMSCAICICCCCCCSAWVFNSGIVSCWYPESWGQTRAPAAVWSADKHHYTYHTMMPTKMNINAIRATHGTYASARFLQAASSPKNNESHANSPSQDAAFGNQGLGGSQFAPDDTLGSAVDSLLLAYDLPLTAYALQRLLSHVTPDQLVHVAHLGLGACCSVDLVAVHCPDGSRLLVAAKSCYLPPSDPRLRASFREAELLRQCADCPFIMQLLALLEQHGLADRGAAAAAPSPGGSISPIGTPPRLSNEMASGLVGMGSEGGSLGMPSTWLSMTSSLESAPSAVTAAAAAMMSSPGYQAWAQWRGGGATEDLEWQIMQRLAAVVNSNGSGSSGGAFDAFGGGGSGGYLGGMGTLASVRSSLTGWDPCASSTSATAVQDDTLGSCGGEPSGCGGGYAAHGYGGGWAHGGGGNCMPGAPAPRARPRCRRASMDIIDMYGGCPGMDGVGGGGATGGGSGVGDGTVEPPAVMCTLLIGWARCGDLRKLVQLLLGRSAAHHNPKTAGAVPAVSCLPLLMPEDAVRFYTGCVVLALEHLHCKLNTVHRDLKLANLLLLDTGYVVVGDLGTAVDLSSVPGGRLNSRVGSPGHMAPECRDRDEAGYDTAADMWSLGACMFSLLTGQLPAGLAGPPNRHWTPPFSRYWSHELQELLARLLAWSPGQRPTVAQLLRDPWFRGFNWTALREQRMQPPSSTPWRELLWWPRENRQLL